MAYVNSATGNLVLQSSDEWIVGRGLDQRATREIPVDSTKRYRVVSRQNLDKANVRDRNGSGLPA